MLWHISGNSNALATRSWAARILTLLFGASNLACAQSGTSPTFPPYAATDPRVILDVGTAALSPLNTWTALPAGFALGQISGLAAGSVSDTAGFVPNSGGYIYCDNALADSLSSQGTIYMRLQRAALAVDDSTDTGSTFFDSTGNATGGYGANAATAFTLYDGSNNIVQWAMAAQASGPQVLDAGAWIYPGSRYANSHGSATINNTYADIIFTWMGSTYWAYLDGVPVATGTFAAALPALGQLTHVVIGGYLGGAGSSGKPLGPFAIQRFQISTAFSSPPVLQGAPVVGFYGDSFVVQGQGVVTDTAVSPTVAQINAVQAQLTPALATTLGASVIGQTGFISRIEAYALHAYGAYVPLYTSAQSGHGWAYSGMGGTTPANTPAIDDFNLGKTAFSDALNAAQPAYVFAFGSVNDVNNGNPSNLVGDVQAHFDYWANNNPNLKRIYFVETLSWELALQACTACTDAAAWTTKMAGQRAQLRSAFASGAVAGTRHVPVTYVQSYETWVQGANSARFLKASNPDNHTQSSANGSAPDGHPDAEGNVQIADAYVWPYLMALLAPQPASLRASATSVAPGASVVLSVSVSGVAPFTYRWFVGSSGDTSQPVANATGATFTTPPLTSTTSYWVQIANSSGTQNTPSVSVVVAAKAIPQAITFPAIPDTVLGTTPFALTAVASSGLPVSFGSQTSTTCTVALGSVSLLQAGACTITADQAGNSTYAAATQVTVTFTVTPVLLSQAITFPVIGAQRANTTIPTPAISASSGLPVTLVSMSPTICSITSSTLTLLAPGTCTIMASQSGNQVYAAAPTVTQAVSVSAQQLSQTIDFAGLPPSTLGTPAVMAVVSATSGLPVILITLTPATCSVSVTAISLLAPGICTVQASQDGNGAYSAAAPVSQSFVIRAASNGGGGAIAGAGGPLPGWALGALGLLLFGIAYPRLRRSSAAVRHSAHDV